MSSTSQPLSASTPISSPTSGPSTNTTPFFTATQSTTGASSTGSSPSPAPSSSSLYLYTFLATLVLLLGISAAIVIRSFILRRRHQGIIDQAIQNGTWNPSTFGGMSRGRRDVGEKPRMWESWVRKDHELFGPEHHWERDITDIQKGYDGTEPGSGWDGILPIAATYLNPPLPPKIIPAASNVGRGHIGHRPILPWRQRTYPSSPAASPSIPSSVLSLPTGARVATSSFSPSLPPPLPIPIPTGSSSSSSPSPLSTPVSPSPASSPDPNSDSTTPPSPPNPTLRLTLLIAMPTPPSMRHARDDEEEEPPVVEFGLIDVDVRSSSLGASGMSGPSNDPVPASGAGVSVGNDKALEAGI